MNKVFIAADHAGASLKASLLSYFKEEGLEAEDLGVPENSERVDYPDQADKLAKAVLAEGEKGRGILICGSGVGMSIRANRFSGIRAALVQTAEMAKLARAHNNANVLCLGERFISQEEARKCAHEFISTPFEGGRHEQRVQKLEKPTQ